jgi:hypothetical protein
MTDQRDDRPLLPSGGSAGYKAPMSVEQARDWLTHVRGRPAG